jgi:bifunctional non-homologous end joining protein LigD
MSDVRVEVDGRVLSLSNLDKVLYPATGTTKGEVLHYYAQIAPLILPRLRDRVVSRVRWPDGVGKPGFFEKNAPAGTPSWVRVVKLPEDGPESGLTMPVIDGVASLTYFANLAALELHVHQWRLDADGRAGPADYVVIDLDPGEPAGLPECCEVALLVRDVFADRGVECQPVLSGSKGIHLYAQLHEPMPSDQASGIAKTVAEQLARDHPALVTATMTKSRRGGRVFLDWSQNNAAKTTITPYSLRGRERPTVAAPVRWDEVEAGAADPLAIGQLRFDEVIARVEAEGW